MAFEMTKPSMLDADLTESLANVREAIEREGVVNARAIRVEVVVPENRLSDLVAMGFPVRQVTDEEGVTVDRLRNALAEIRLLASTAEPVEKRGSGTLRG